MERNIKLAHFLSFAFHGWFWMGNWIFYYLTFGGYATVAMLDSGALLAGVLYEIPTGAFADMVGKKKTLILAFFFQMIGNVLMGLSNSVWMLAGSLWIFICLAYAFYSGTMEAFIYDSLKSAGKEKEYDKRFGSVGALRLWAMASCAVIGGVAYNYFPGLPFLLSATLSFVGLVLCFFLQEPKVDTEKFSLKTFFVQNTRGIKVLFGNSRMSNLSWYLVLSGAMVVFVYNLLDDLLAIEYGYSPTSISWLFAIACLVAGLATYLIPKLNWKISLKWSLVFPMIVMGLVLALSPIYAFWVAGGTLMFRVILESIYQNYTSVAINENTDSNVRATTLSTLSLLRNIPYALLGTFVGVVVNYAGGAINFSMWYGVVLVIISMVFGLRLKVR